MQLKPQFALHAFQTAGEKISIKSCRPFYYDPAELTQNMALKVTPQIVKISQECQKLSRFLCFFVVGAFYEREVSSI